MITPLKDEVWAPVSDRRKPVKILWTVATEHTHNKREPMIYFCTYVNGERGATQNLLLGEFLKHYIGRKQ